MSPPNRLETPPPTSRFRRPWSPEPFDPNPRSESRDIGLADLTDMEHHRGRREPSEASIEALDLADYARTLTQDPRTREAVVFRPYDAYPPSPRAIRPFASRDYFSIPPVLSPSSSTSQSHSQSRSPTGAPRANRRPFSLPVPPASRTSHYPSIQSHPSYSSRSSAAHTVDPDDPLLTPPPEPDDGIDIAHFPRFTRGWYANPVKSHGFEPPVRLNSDVFDPSFPAEKFTPYQAVPPIYSPPHLGSVASHSTRDAVPWGDTTAEGAPLDPAVKEERIRMLEREFARESGKQKEDEEHMIGSVDSKGKLITEGPKKRAATRRIQILLSLLAGGSSIYAALFIKTSSKPPPASKPQAFALYIVSVITFMILAYMFIIYPCCCGGRRRKALDTPFTEGPGGMMVLPVPNGQPTKKNKKRRGRGRGKKGQEDPGQSVQVNLIVDPEMFGRRDEEEEEEDYSESEHTIPGSFAPRHRRRGHRGKRRGIFAGLALEAQWKQARKTLKRTMMLDVAMFFVWGALFVYILIGKRCPTGAFNGWCDGYNVATAASCLLCLAFGFSVFFDIKDLHASKSSPRTRT